MRMIAFILIIITSFTNCKREKKTDGYPKLEILEEHILSVPEPSSLALNFVTGNFLVVSDNTGKAYEISREGELIRSFPFSGDDPEGIVMNPQDYSIYITEEKLREIVCLDSSGNEICRYHVNISAGQSNKGLEGIAVSVADSSFFLVNEDDPPVLLHTDLSGNILKSVSLSFADDYSDLFFDPVNNKLWILSDESETVSRCSTNGTVEQTYSTGISKAEGLVVFPETLTIYLVSDDQHTLYKMKIPE